MATVTYSDINTFVQVMPGSDILTGDDAVQNMVFNVLLCQCRSRGFRKTYGSWAEFYLQRPATPANAAALKLSLYNSLNYWCNQVAQFALNNIQVAASSDGTKYYVAIGYNSLTTNTNQSVKFTLNAVKISGTITT
jgi:phage baseplate assembly protein W